MYEIIYHYNSFINSFPFSSSISWVPIDLFNVSWILLLPDDRCTHVPYGLYCSSDSPRLYCSVSSLAVLVCVCALDVCTVANAPNEAFHRAWPGPIVN